MQVQNAKKNLKARDARAATQQAATRRQPMLVQPFQAGRHRPTVRTPAPSMDTGRTASQTQTPWLAGYPMNVDRRRAKKLDFILLRSSCFFALGLTQTERGSCCTCRGPLQPTRCSARSTYPRVAGWGGARLRLRGRPGRDGPIDGRKRDGPIDGRKSCPPPWGDSAPWR
jgi:hypothetical protein